MLPDQDVSVPKPRPTASLADLRKDPIRWRATLHGWIACFAQAASIIKFIERNWDLPKLSHRSRDNLPNPVTSDDNPYVPKNRPAIGDL